MPLRILVADDHEVVRHGLRAGLAAFDIVVVAEAAHGDELLVLFTLHECDLVLLDVRMPVRDGLSTLEQLKSRDPNCRVVLMSGIDNPHFVAQAIKLGAKGFVSKKSSVAEFAAVVKSVFAGGETFDRDSGRRITGALATRRLGVEYDVPLTMRECQVLRNLGEGLTNKQIADAMSISYETVKEHVQHILKKVGVIDRTQAVYWGLRVGLIPIEGQSKS